MPSLNELLKSAGIKDEVITGLPKEVTAAIDGYVADAAKKHTDAAEALRLAEAEKKEISDYVAQYGTALTDHAALKARYDALVKFTESLKGQGIEIPALPAEAAPVVPGSPARGANSSDFNPDQFSANVFDVMTQFTDVNNEYQRLFGAPLPDSSKALALEAKKNKMPLSDYAAKKYGFEAKRTEIQAAARQKEIDAEVTKRVEAERQKLAEQMGSNPNLRPGVPSRNSIVPKISSDEFKKASENMPTLDRKRRMLDGIHRDVEAAKASA